VLKVSKEDLKFVIVGHVDHGKSTLIGRLLYDTKSIPEEKINEIKEVCESLGKELEFGYILDHLEEERDQGITIDTTQIFFDTEHRHYTIIDAPGHVEFLKNMITGASQAEAAILIVDAEEGVQEQTRRHAYILSMLGLKQVIVVVNKMDLVNYSKERYEEVRSEIEKHLKKISITPNHYIPISARTGENIATKSESMDWYSGPTVLEALDAFTPTTSLKELPLRFAVQDVYKHEQRVVVGRVESGTLRRGMEVIILPSGESSSITSIEEFLKDDVTEAEAGTSTGLITSTKVFIARGNILAEKKEQPTVTDTIRARLFWMDKEPAQKGERLLFKCSTQEVMAEIEEFELIINSSTLEPIEREELRNREVALVTIKTSKPVVIEDFNRNPNLGKFVLEKKYTVAGGIITE